MRRLKRRTKHVLPFTARETIRAISANSADVINAEIETPKAPDPVTIDTAMHKTLKFLRNRRVSPSCRTHRLFESRWKLKADKYFGEEMLNNPHSIRSVCLPAVH